MMSMQELFYGPNEPTWIVHPRRRYGKRRNYYRIHGQCPACASVENHMPAVQTVLFKVPLCCDKCVRTIKEEFLSLDDVERVACDQWTQQVTITSSIDPEKLLKRLQKFKKRSTFWPA
ncbi:hypothetical protein M758_8G131900 [Ceratodon purpureus]|nr:hypothetical protein M758_8G131900 [Ceratodon purpureus]